MAVALRSLFDRYFIKQPLLRERITRAVYGESDVEVPIFGLPFTINSLRENGYLRASRMGRSSSLYADEVLTLQRISLFFGNGVTFCDIGANIGIYSGCAAAASQLFPEFRVEAFEAHPKTFSRLKANADRLGFRATNCAVSNEAAELTFVEGAVSHVTTEVDMANDYSISSRTLKVTARRLDSFDFSGQLVMKIDVEGQELKVLEGATGFFDEQRVDVVYIDGYRDPALWQFLEAYGFRFFDSFNLRPAEKSTFHLLAVHERLLDENMMGPGAAARLAANERTRVN